MATNKTAGWIQVVLGLLIAIWGFTNLYSTQRWGVWLFGLLVLIVGLWEVFSK